MYSRASLGILLWYRHISSCFGGTTEDNGCSRHEGIGMGGPRYSSSPELSANLPRATAVLLCVLSPS